MTGKTSTGKYNVCKNASVVVTNQSFSYLHYYFMLIEFQPIHWISLHYTFIILIIASTSGQGTVLHCPAIIHKTSHYFLLSNFPSYVAQNHVYNISGVMDFMYTEDLHCPEHCSFKTIRWIAFFMSEPQGELYL